MAVVVIITEHNETRSARKSGLHGIAHLLTSGFGIQ